MQCAYVYQFQPKWVLLCIKFPVCIMLSTRSAVHFPLQFCRVSNQTHKLSQLSVKAFFAEGVLYFKLLFWSELHVCIFYLNRSNRLEPPFHFLIAPLMKNINDNRQQFVQRLFLEDSKRCSRHSYIFHFTQEFNRGQRSNTRKPKDTNTLSLAGPKLKMQ